MHKLLESKGHCFWDNNDKQRLMHTQNMKAAGAEMAVAACRLLGLKRVRYLHVALWPLTLMCREADESVSTNAAINPVMKSPLEICSRPEH